MTDLEKFVAIYKSFGIRCIVNEIYAEDRVTRLKQIILVWDTDTNILDTETYSHKFGGYLGHCTEVLFTLEGVFYKQSFLTH